MFQFPGFASPAYEFSRRYRRSGGLPHSEIHGSKPARGSPWLIATCCVLHRLSVPRHPPDALQTLDLICAYPSTDRRSDDRVSRNQHSPNATRRGKPAQKRSSRRCITTQPLNRLSHRSRHSRNPWCQRITLSDHPWSLILFTMSIDPVSAHPRRANTNRFSAETPPPCCQGAARSDEKGCGDGGTEVCGPRLP